MREVDLSFLQLYSRNIKCIHMFIHEMNKKKLYEIARKKICLFVIWNVTKLVTNICDM